MSSSRARPNRFSPKSGDFPHNGSLSSRVSGFAFSDPTSSASSYERFQRDPHHPSLQFKQVHSSRPIYSVRVGLGYRALGSRSEETMIWFWIGSHADYDRLVDKNQ